FSPIPPGAARAAARAEGVELVATLRGVEAELLGDGSKEQVSALSPNAGEVFDLEWEQGGPRLLAGLGDGEAAVKESFASAHGLEVGDRFRLLSQSGARPGFRIAGIYGTDIETVGGVIVNEAVMAREFGQTQDVMDFVRL